MSVRSTCQCESLMSDRHLKKNILFISRNLPPLIGGMERLSAKLHDGLAASYQVTTIGPKGCSHLCANHRTIELPKNPVVFILLSTLIAIWLSATRRYDYVIGTSGLIGP